MTTIKLIMDPKINFSLMERAKRLKELALRKIARRLPRKLAYWSFIDTGSRYMGDSEVVPEVRYTDILRRFGNDVEKSR